MDAPTLFLSLHASSDRCHQRLADELYVRKIQFEEGGARKSVPSVRKEGSMRNVTVSVN
jgi:hypothetical protein